MRLHTNAATVLRGALTVLFAIAVMAASAAGFAQDAAPSAPPYAVVQGEHPPGVDPRQQLTVLCPATHRAFGVGYAALLPAGVDASGQQIWRDAMLDAVRAMPDSAGSGFLVEGYVAEVERTGQPWFLVVRVVCVQIAQ